MNKHYGPVNIAINQVADEDGFSHWMWVLTIGGQDVSLGTGPTFWGCINAAQDTFSSTLDYEPGDMIDLKWFNMDSNHRDN